MTAWFLFVWACAASPPTAPPVQTCHWVVPVAPFYTEQDCHDEAAALDFIHNHMCVELPLERP